MRSWGTRCPAISKVVAALALRDATIFARTLSVVKFAGAPIDALCFS